MGYKFIKTKDPENPYSVADFMLKIDYHDISLPELLEEIECFLRASGYMFKGNLEIVEDDSE